MRKKALITGITGQDGSYLAELLLEKGYEVHGIKRRASSFNTDRIDHLFQDIHSKNPQLVLHYGDMTDSANLIKLVSNIRPDEVYNLAAQSHVKVSFDIPEYTANCDAIGTLRILEAIRIAGLEKTCKFYQASTSELYGGQEYNRPENGYTEESPMHPRSPYGCAKLYAMRITRNYKESYGIFACNGILFNHESPRRGETFVTRKITMAVARISLGLQEKLYIGNLDAKRDRGHAKDFVYAMWLMLQQEIAQDYVIATGVAYTVREFINRSFEEIGITLDRQGEGVHEKGYDTKSGVCLVEVDPTYFRPAEVDFLLGDSHKARVELGWKPSVTVQDMCKEMVASDIQAFKQEQLLKKHGYFIAQTGITYFLIIGNFFYFHTIMFIPKETYKEILMYVPIPTVDMVLVNKNKEVVLGFRTNKPLQGIYYLPGGRVRKGETLLQAVKRKAKEELGLDIPSEKFRFVGVYDDIIEGSAFEGVDMTHCIASTFFYQISDEEIEKIQYDQRHESFKFFTFNDKALDPYLLDRLSAIQSTYTIF